MKRVYLVSLITLTLWVALLVGKMIMTQIQSTKYQAISSYDECTATGYPVMESDPPQCRIPGGKIFIAAKPSLPLENPSVTKPGSATPSSSPAESARADLAKKLVIGIEAITIVSQQEADWPDGCLGIHKPDIMCTMAIVPGYEVILSFANELYTYRTNKDGSIIVQVL